MSTPSRHDRQILVRMDEGTEPAGPPTQALTDTPTAPAEPRSGATPDGLLEGDVEYELVEATWWHKSIVRTLGVLIALFIVVVIALVVYGSFAR
jgi:hypothetical protein